MDYQEKPHTYAGEQVVSIKCGQQIEAHLEGHDWCCGYGDWKQRFNSEREMFNEIATCGHKLLGWAWVDKYEFIPYDEYKTWIKMGREQ